MNYMNQGNGRPNGQKAPQPAPDQQREDRFSPLNESRGRVLITGGAGFIGVNLADRLLQAGHRVIILDNLSRQGVDRNLRWLKDTHGDAVDVRIADVQQTAVVNQCVAEASAIFHLAAQVAVTSSLEDPRHDFNVNLGGTINLLEALRSRPTPPPLLFTSTYKVYGDLRGLDVQLEGERYEPTHYGVRMHGFAEGWLDFHSPYGCSKGAADQYVLDYARTYKLPATVFRMSCIYGPHQCGNEDQGWVCHFLKAAMQHQSVTLYGDGHQVRDVLFIQDLVNAMFRAIGHIDQTAGQAFNIGGGPANALSIIEMLNLIDQEVGQQTPVKYGPWRRGDQRYYVTDFSRFHTLTQWQPKVGVQDGVQRLHQWLQQASPQTRQQSLAAGD